MGKYRVKVDDWYAEFEIIPSDPNLISVELDPNSITLEDFADPGILVSHALKPLAFLILPSPGSNLSITSPSDRQSYFQLSFGLTSITLILTPPNFIML